MRVAIDAHALGRGQAGYESYLRHLTRSLLEVAPRDQFLLYSDLASTRARRWLRDLPRLLRADRPDVLHTQYAAPWPCSVPLVATIHDLSFHDIPESFPPAERWLLRAAVWRTVRLARRILTVSEFSRQRLMAVYGLHPRRILVAPNGVGREFGPAPPGSAFGGDPYILMVGDLSPRKNHAALIAAFASMAAAGKPYRLKVAGRRTAYSPVIERLARASGAAAKIDFLGYVPDSLMPDLYRGASACVYPSLYEGFGLPVIEAMACGTPVVCSRIPALAEVTGGAALLFDPRRPEDLREALEAALLNARFWRAAGLERSRAFSWREAARITWRAYREACVEAGNTGRVSATTEASRLVNPRASGVD